MKSLLIAGAAAVLLAGPAAAADTWPNQPIHVVVPYAPGGTVDTISRYLGDKLQGVLDTTLVIDNRPGAGGNIGTEAVTRARPDGYTWLIAGFPTHALNPHLYDLTYDPMTDLTNLALIGTSPNFIVIHPDLPFDTVEDLVSHARENPGELAYSSSGTGTTGHLAGEMLASQADIEIRHIPYKGQADAITGVMRGDVAFSIVTIPATLPQIEAGRLKAIGITSAERSPLAPEVPTVVESGYPEFVVLAWYNLSAPPGLDADIARQITDAVGEVMGTDDTRERLANLGIEPSYLIEQDYEAFLKEEFDNWGSVIRSANVRKE